MKKITLNDLKAAQVPQSRAFKAGLKEQLIAKYPRPNPFMKTLFRLSISFAVIALLITQVVLPGESKDTLQKFIQEASAATEAHGDEIYHAHIERTQEMYFDNTDGFKGWQTTWESSQELWVAPTKDIRSENTFSAWNGPQEDGTFEEVTDGGTGLTLYDEYGNQLSYAKLEVTGTELVEKDGEMVEQNTYNVHPGKQHSTEELKEDFLNKITCVNVEEGENFTGYAWADIDEQDSSTSGVSMTSSPINERYNLMLELEPAIDGRMPIDEMLALLEKIQNDEQIKYELKEVDSKLQHVIEINQKDFAMTSSSSSDALKYLEPNDQFVTFYFDAETYRLTKMTDVTYNHGVETARGSMIVTSSDYINYEENLDLFKADESFVADGLSSRFEQKISDFETGCYRRYEKLSDEETEKWLNILRKNLTEGDLNYWTSPLRGNGNYYYVIPGDPTIYEVK